MNESVRISAARVEQAFESQDRDYPQLLNDAYKLMQYARHAQAMIGGGDTAISQLEQASEAYRSERDAAQHFIVEASVIPGIDCKCRCDQCATVARGLENAGYLANYKFKWWDSPSVGVESVEHAGGVTMRMNDPDYQWRPATRGDIGSIARFTNRAEEGWVYGLLLDISNNPDWHAWKFEGIGINGSDEPNNFRQCEIQYDANKEP